MPAWISVVVFALAVARVTRFVTADKLSESVRNRIIWRLWLRSCHGDAELVRLKLGNQAPPPLSVYLLTCPWCVSIWIGMIAAPLCWAWGDTPYAFIPALWLAFSHVTGLLAKIEG